MPYYLGAGEPEWDEYMEIIDDLPGDPPTTMFKYVEPWLAKTTVLHFPETPGPRPEGKNAEPASQQLSPEQLIERWQKEQEAASELALWKVSSMTAKCRAAGVKRVFGGYDGGGDESFSHFRGIEMNDGRVISTFGEETAAINGYELVGNAAFALLGRHDAGEFLLRGAVVIDFDACTITDEKDIDVVFDR